MSQAITDQDFNQEVIKSETPVLVDFWAEWCAPCKMVGPVIDELAAEYQGKLKVFKLNVDQNSEMPSKYGVMSIPTILMFKNGEVVKSMVGAQPKDSFKREIDQVINQA